MATTGKGNALKLLLERLPEALLIEEKLWFYHHHKLDAMSLQNTLQTKRRNTAKMQGIRKRIGLSTKAPKPEVCKTLPFDHAILMPISQETVKIAEQMFERNASFSLLMPSDLIPQIGTNIEDQMKRINLREKALKASKIVLLGTGLTWITHHSMSKENSASRTHAVFANPKMSKIPRKTSRNGLSKLKAAARC